MLECGGRVLQRNVRRASSPGLSGMRRGVYIVRVVKGVGKIVASIKLALVRKEGQSGLQEENSSLVILPSGSSFCKSCDAIQLELLLCKSPDLEPS